jgi:signal transduction histidine kinase
MIKKILLLVFIISSIQLQAQQNGITYSLQQYTTDNGLPSNLIRGMEWDDATGFLWIVSEGGLSRFNGVDFRLYYKEKVSPAAPANPLYTLRNNKGNIFTSDGSGNIYTVKNNTAALSKPATLSKSLLNHLFIAVSDTFFNNKIKLPATFNAAIQKIAALTDTSCIILFKNKLYTYSISQPAPVLLPLPPQNIQALFKINDTCFFISDALQAYSINNTSFKITPAPLLAADKSIFNFTNGYSRFFWHSGAARPVIIKNNNAWVLNFNAGNISAALITNAVPDGTDIYAVEYAEKNKTLFIGTESQGIISITENPMQPKKRNNANPKNKNAYFAQLALDENNILTNEGDIISRSTTYTKALPIKGKFSTRVSITNNNNLIWYNATDAKLGYNCLHQYNRATGTTKVFDRIKLFTNVESAATKNYFANNKGIGILQGDSIYYLHQYNNGRSSLSMYDFKEVTPGVFVMAGCNGILRFNTNTNTLDTLYSAPNICFGGLWKYKDYIFWGSYGYGFYVYKNGMVKQMPVDKNEYLLYTHCFVPDAYGYCWISTNRGLFKVQIDEMLAHFNNSSIPVYYHYFGKKDGIEMTELNGGCTPCAVTLPDETISFPTMDGLLWAHPPTIKPIIPEGEIYIDEITADGVILNPDAVENNLLPAAVQELVFKLGFAAWCNKENLYIDYQLNDTLHWKKFKDLDNAVIQLNGLAAGSYTLRIRKRSGFGINNYVYKTVQFEIEKKWYNRWWFYALVAGAVLGLIALVNFIRTRQYALRQKKLEMQVAEKTKELQQKNEVLEKNDTIKTRLISIISHDIVTPLKFLTMAGKNLVEKKAVMPEQLQEDTLKEMASTSQELHQLSTNILNWIKYQNENRRLAKEKFNVHDVAGHVTSIMRTLAKQKKLQLLNNIPESMELNQYLEPLRILLYNLVANAINFTEKGTIAINSFKENNKTFITVTDEGVGMTPEQIQNIMSDQFIVSSTNIDNRKGNGLGYLIIKDLIKMMGANFQIKSEKGRGTSVSVIIPD